MTFAFLGIWIGSRLDSSARGAAEKAAYEAQFVRAEIGIGAAGASGH